MLWNFGEKLDFKNSKIFKLNKREIFMGNLKKLLDKVESDGWSQKNIEEYFRLSNEEELREYNSGNFRIVRDYKQGDDIEGLICRIGDYSLNEFLEEDYNIKILENERKICGMIATRNDGNEKYIGAIAVSEGMEGKGYMGNLIDAVYDGTPLIAKVAKGNPATEAFKKYGFRVRSILNGWQGMVRD